MAIGRRNSIQIEQNPARGEWLKPSLRVALFADTFFEPNGVATVCREFVTFAEQQQIPFCCVHAGTVRQASRQGSLTTLELNRGPASFPLDKDLQCDPLLSRHRKWVVDQLKEFQPDLIHITGTGDFGTLGLWVAKLLGVPRVASWHTNVHEYASQRLQKVFGFAPRGLRKRIGAVAEEQSLNATMRFYGLAHFLLAPNREMVDQLHQRTRRPAYLMAHGVDTTRFSPAWRKRAGGSLSIGYVGRLTPEKNLRWFRELERRLLAVGQRDFRIVLVGDGSEREWLRKNLEFGDLPGVLRGDSLAAAFADLDIFVFPSRTDTFGLVILEAMASGVPVVLTPETGARVQVQNGVTGVLTEDLAEGVLQLMQDAPSRCRMGAEARRFASSRDWTHVFEDLYRAYDEALKTEEVRSRIGTRA
jgi:phosphatidylinositol alpha 1,6-mannosyltransferase